MSSEQHELDALRDLDRAMADCARRGEALLPARRDELLAAVRAARLLDAEQAAAASLARQNHLVIEMLDWDEVSAGQEFIVMSRTPQETGPPLYAEVDALPARSYRLDRNATPPTLSVAVRVANVTEPVAEWLRAPHRQAVEMWMYQHGKRVFTGELQRGSISKGVLTLDAVDMNANPHAE